MTRAIMVRAIARSCGHTEQVKTKEIDQSLQGQDLQINETKKRKNPPLSLVNLFDSQIYKKKLSSHWSNSVVYSLFCISDPIYCNNYRLFYSIIIFFFQSFTPQTPKKYTQEIYIRASKNRQKKSFRYWSFSPQTGSKPKKYTL